MKKLTVFCCFILAIFSFSIASAQIEKGVEEERTEITNGEAVGIDEGEQGVNIELASEWLSKYVSTGGVAFSRDPVVQSSLTLTLPSGFYGQVWHSTNIDANLLDNPGAELNFYLGWSGRLYRVANPFINTLEVDFSISYQAYPKLSKMENAFLGLELEIKRPFDLDGGHRLSPFVAAEYYYPLSGNGGEQGMYGSVGLKHSWKILFPIFLEQSIRATYDSGVYGMESGLIGAYTASVQWKATEHLRVDLGQVQYTVPISSFRDRKNEFVYGVGIRYEF